MSFSNVNWQDLVKNRRPRLPLLATRLWPHLRPFSGRMAVVALCGVAAAAADLLSIGLLVPVLQTIVGRGEIVVPFLPADSPPIAWLGALPPETRVGWLLGGMLAAQCAREATVYANAAILASTHAAIASALRMKAYDRFVGLPLSALQAMPLATYYTILNSFSQQGADAATIAARMTVPATTALALAGLLAWMSVPLTGLAAALLGLVALAIGAIIARQQRAFAALADEATVLNHRTYELCAAIRTIKLFNREPLMRAHQDAAAGRYWRTSVRSQLWAHAIGAVSQVMIMIGVVAIFLAGTALFAHVGDGWTEAILLFLYVTKRLAGPVTQLNALRGDFAASAPGADLIGEFLAEAPHARAVAAARPAQGPIRFEGVSFRYDGAPSDALDRVDLEIPVHRVTAIVGPSGAGKSTLVDLLLGLRRPTTGRLTFGGVDAAAIDEAGIRAHVALVSQDTYLFADTIRENVRFGRPDATDAQVEDAVARANLVGVIAELPAGLDTWVGERGVRLSGGQAQRVAIARAVLADPAVLVLDEATSAQDAESERAIRDAVRGLARERTIVVVAHRLASVRDADAIVVLDAGRAIETGTHAELIARGGLYARFVAMQDLSV
jgi:ATP-binding cassette, subfamily B, bacterial MsbA